MGRVLETDLERGWLKTFQYLISILVLSQLSAAIPYTFEFKALPKTILAINWYILWFTQILCCYVLHNPIIRTFKTFAI